MIKKLLIEVPGVVVLLNLITAKAMKILTRMAKILAILAAKDTIVVGLELLVGKANASHTFLLSEDFLVENDSDQADLIREAHGGDIVEFLLISNVDLTISDHHVDVVVFLVELSDNFNDVSHNLTPFPLLIII